MKLHTGDTVLIISGKDRGKTGTILKVLEEESRVVVGGVNIRTRHMKKSFDQAGRIIKYEASVSASNAMILDPKTGKPARIGYKVDENGKKIRVSKISGEEVKNVKPKKEKVTKGTESAKGTKEKEIKEVKETKESKEIVKKAPFWKKMGFGSAAIQDAEVKESALQKDHSIPDQQMHARSAGRGS